MMKIAIGIGGPASGGQRNFAAVVDFVVEAEKLGVDVVWSAEAWGMDAIAPLAFIGARTSRIKLGTGIMQISARAPVNTAMTALSMAAITNDRFILGLGVSGPQVVEGLHGQPYGRPLTRLRETVDIIKMACRGDKIRYQGKHFQLPLPGGEGKPLRLAQEPNPHIPLYLATLGPRSLEYTGEVADGWVGTSFSPEGADAVVPIIAAGAQKAGRTIADLDLQAGGSVGFGDAEPLVQAAKRGLAFTLGAMGSPTTNFYNGAWRRQGYEAEAAESQRLWVEGKRDEAIAAVPDAMVLQSNFFGSEADVRARIRAYRDAGITTLMVTPTGSDASARLDTLGRFVALVRDETGEASAGR